MVWILVLVVGFVLGGLLPIVHRTIGLILLALGAGPPNSDHRWRAYADDLDMP